MLFSLFIETGIIKGEGREDEGDQGDVDGSEGRGRGVTVTVGCCPVPCEVDQTPTGPGITGRDPGVEPGSGATRDHTGWLGSPRRAPPSPPSGAQDDTWAPWSAGPSGSRPPLLPSRDGEVASVEGVSQRGVPPPIEPGVREPVDVVSSEGRNLGFQRTGREIHTPTLTHADSCTLGTHTD